METNERLKKLNDLIDVDNNLDTMGIYGVMHYSNKVSLSLDDLEFLLKLGKENNREALNILFKYYYQMIVWRSLRYKSDFLSEEDLVQDGSLGFLEAVKTYDFLKSTSFETWLYWQMKKEIMLDLAGSDKVLKIDNNMLVKISKIKTFLKSEKEKSGKVPGIFEISEHFKMKESTVYLLLGLSDRVSFDDEIAKEVTVGLSDKENNYEIIKILKTYLSKDEFMVFRYIYGFDGDVKSFEEVASILNISKSRVQYLLRQGLIKLKSTSAYVLLKEYYYKDYIAPVYNAKIMALKKEFREKRLAK